MEARLLVGIDWDNAGYEICVLNPSGKVMEEFRVKHSAEELAGFVEGLLARVGGEATGLAVGIETPRGALVELLLERQIAVFAINPKQSDRLRDRHRPSGAKDDPGDAYVVADGLRNDRHLFHQVEVDHPLIIELREMLRADEDLGEEWIRLTNRMREQLHRTHPHVLELIGSGQDPWFWDLVERVVVNGTRLTRTPIQGLLRRHRIRRLTAEEVLAVVQQPTLQVAGGTANAVRAQLHLLLARVRLVHTQRKECGKRLEELLEAYIQDERQGKAGEPGMAEIVCSIPGVGVRVASALLGEGSHQLQSAEPGALLRAYGGAAPVTKRSGKRIIVLRRYSCNRRLQHAFFHWARTSLQTDALARAYYADLRARGHTHGRALRAVADRWLRILDAMLKSRTLYDPARLKATKRIAGDVASNTIAA